MPRSWATQLPQPKDEGSPWPGVWGLTVQRRCDHGSLRDTLDGWYEGSGETRSICPWDLINRNDNIDRECKVRSRYSSGIESLEFLVQYSRLARLARLVSFIGVLRNNVGGGMDGGSEVGTAG